MSVRLDRPDALRTCIVSRAFKTVNRLQTASVIHYHNILHSTATASFDIILPGRSFRNAFVLLKIAVRLITPPPVVRRPTACINATGTRYADNDINIIFS